VIDWLLGGGDKEKKEESEVTSRIETWESLEKAMMMGSVLNVLSCWYSGRSKWRCLESS
jgi:hypothetical protein